MRPKPAPLRSGSLLDRCERAVIAGRQVRATCVELSARTRELLERRAAIDEGTMRCTRAAEDEEPRRAPLPDLALLAHDLRSPLAAILNWTEVLRATRGAGGALERAVDAMQASGLEALKLLERLLDDVGPGGNRKSAPRAPLPDVVARVVQSLDVFAEQRGVAVSTTTAPDAAALRADPVLFGRIVRNLLENALRHTPFGGHVWVTLERADDLARLTIADDGMGIRAADLPRVFQPFWTRAGTQAAGVRRGLGLASVRQVVERHGGSVRVESAGPGRGTTFVVLMPCADA